MSHKFKEVQQNYQVFEMETLAILEVLTKWEDKLIGQKFIVIMDHQLLEFFSRQKHLPGRQAQWAEYLSHFDFKVTYVKGQYNIVADCLSRYYLTDYQAKPMLTITMCRLTCIWTQTGTTYRMGS